ncbi:MAG: acyltransferase domain-containing protein, partial [Acidimicrobiia bacterium]|nr:acyltransferase domain-containing protein [Acidimicrobiia bacterium]
MDGLSFDDCLRVVDDPSGYECWREDYACSGPYVVDSRLDLPFVDDLAERCVDYGFPDRATELLVTHRDSWDHPAVQRLAAHFQWLVVERYHPRTYLQLGFPAPPPTCRLFYPYALLGLAGRVADEQRDAGIDPAVTAATFWDVGQQVMLHERIHREVDCRKGWWLCHHLAGALFRVGSLQFQRSYAGSHHGPDAAGQPLLDVHIPEGAALDPTSCARSFADGATFFDHHVPDHGAEWFGCSSWMLDPVLAQLLSPDANVVAFQQRF